MYMYVWYIFVLWKDAAVCQCWITFNSMKVEDTHCVYEGEDIFLWLPTSFGSHKTAMRCCHCVLDCKQSELGIGQVSYAVVLLVSPLVLLTIGKFTSLSERCFVIAPFSAFYVYYFWISSLYSIPRRQATWMLQFSVKCPCMCSSRHPGGVGQALRCTWNNYIPFLGMRKVHGDLQRLNK